ncbi:MAG: SDR family oxidoreductase [Hyphomicrobiales bacterium]|nr:SDR family oxidoreductase [Hyphomicrobiales bacterium]
MDLGLSDRKAVICASSRGLGRGCAVALAEAGCSVVINGRNAHTLTDTAKDIHHATGAKVDVVVADVSTIEGQNALLAACPDPDILVNNNGGPPFRDFRELDRQAILEGVTQNMVTPIELIQSVIDGMCERRFGRIVNITSSSVYMPIRGLDLSSGARAGLTSFLAGVARSVADRNVTINTLLPGKMDTDRLTSSFQNTSAKTGKSIDEVKAAALQNIPASRMGTPEEFGNTCAFLCSRYAGYITGRNLLVDGGLYPSAF